MNCFQHAETSLQRQGRDLTTSFARKLPDTWSLPVTFTLIKRPIAVRTVFFIWALH